MHVIIKDVSFSLKGSKGDNESLLCLISHIDKTFQCTFDKSTLFCFSACAYSTVSETFISFTLTNVEFRKSRDFFACILSGSSVGFAWY